MAEKDEEMKKNEVDVKKAEAEEKAKTKNENI